MTTEEFWEIYINTKEITTIFDQTYDFFSKELPTEFIENYDVGEVILETKEHQESAKEFEKVLKFTTLLQQKHPDLYLDHFQYFDDFLIDYHVFHGRNKEVEKAFTNFIENLIRALTNCCFLLRKYYFINITIWQIGLQQKFMIQ